MLETSRSFIGNLFRHGDWGDVVSVPSDYKFCPSRSVEDTIADAVVVIIVAIFVRCFSATNDIFSKGIRAADFKGDFPVGSYED